MAESSYYQVSLVRPRPPSSARCFLSFCSSFSSFLSPSLFPPTTGARVRRIYPPSDAIIEHRSRTRSGISRLSTPSHLFSCPCSLCPSVRPSVRSFLRSFGRSFLGSFGRFVRVVHPRRTCIGTRQAFPSSTGYGGEGVGKGDQRRFFRGSRIERAARESSQPRRTSRNSIAHT